MSLPSLIDEINRLFDELIHDPWVRPIGPPTAPQRRAGTDWEAEVPLPGVKGGEFALSIEGRQLTVLVHRRKVRQNVRGGKNVESSEAETYRQSFVLPVEADLSSMTVRLESGKLLIRIRLRQRAESSR